jgi:hypothetical protein
MLGNLFLFAANRATQGAVGNVARQATWSALAIVLLLAGGFFTLVVAFMLLAAKMGAESAAVILAAACIVAGLVCLSVPNILARVEKAEAAAKAAAPAPLIAAETSAAVHDEMTQAVDYFGAVRVIASAFMLGFGAAKQLKHRQA